MQIETIVGYRFKPSDLRISERLPGISAFLRTRNGADFVEATIRSHIGFYDEIIAVYNQCEDDTGAVLARLAAAFAPKLRVFHYTDRVQPLGSEGHANTPGDHPESMVNYSNFALAQTRYQVVVKLDDDHLAIPSALGQICDQWRTGQADKDILHCFSGLNLARRADGALGIPAVDPVSGGGDIGYFFAAKDIYFRHDRRFERFGRGGLKRVFAGYLYWHLKFLKTGGGFKNYELADHPDSRFARKQQVFQESALLDLPEICKALQPSMADRVLARGSDKLRLKTDRNSAALANFPDTNLLAALDRLSPGWQEIPGLGGLT